jgi:LysM repeat protein
VTLDSKAISAENAVYTVAKPDGSAVDLSVGTLFAANILTVDAAEQNTSLKITASVLIDKTQYKADLIISLTDPAKNVTSISIAAEQGEITVSDAVQTIKITSSYGPADAKAPVLSFTMARDDKAAFAKDTAIDPVLGTVTIGTSEKAGTITVTAADAADDLQAETAISVKKKHSLHPLLLLYRQHLLQLFLQHHQHRHLQLCHVHHRKL